jgi:hypothetical protein
MKRILPVCMLAPWLSSTGYSQAPNNNFANAEVLITGVSVPGDLTGGTKEANEPNAHRQTTATAPRTVWYSWTPATTGLHCVELNTKVPAGGTAAPPALIGAVYSGAAFASLQRVAHVHCNAGTAAAGTVAAIDGAKGYSEAFIATANTTYFIQVTAANLTAAAGGPFQIAATKFLPQPNAQATTIIPMGGSWEWLHPLAAVDPTADTTWAATWFLPGNASDYDPDATGTLTFAAAAPAPLAFGSLDRAPGQATGIGLPVPDANNNAAYFRRSFNLPTASTNLWAEILADDGAWIFIDGQPVAPVNIVAKTTASTATPPVYAFEDFRSKPSVHLTASTAPAPNCFAINATNTESQTKMVFLGDLAAGDHNIAVSLHQSGITSTDNAFDFQLLNVAPRKLTDGPVKITFDDAPLVVSTANALSLTTQQFAPRANQTDAAWKVIAPATRGATVLRAPYPAFVAGTAGPKRLRLNGAECGNFYTEPVDVTGLASFVASLKIQTLDSSSGFEAGDGFHVYLQTSADGLTFSDTGLIDVQPAVSGNAEANTPFTAGVLVSKQVTDNTANFVRLVIKGGTDSNSETVFFDDISISLCQVQPTVASVVYNNQGDDDALNDTVTFSLTVSGLGTTGPGWTTSGLLGGEVTSPAFGAGNAQSITKPATNASGVRTALSFFVEDGGDAACRQQVTVAIPAGAITATIPATSVTRLPGVSATDPDDDVLEIKITPTGTNVGQKGELRTNDANNTLLGDAVYGTEATVTVPLYTTVAGVKTLTTTLRVQDKADATIRAATANFLGLIPPAIGRNALDNSLIYATAAGWRQVGTQSAALTGLGMQLSSTTALVNNVTPAAVAESSAISLAGASAVVTGVLGAWENSPNSNFEPEDTLRFDVLETVGGVETVVNLTAIHRIAGTLSDVDAGGTLNGTEFNLNAAAAAANATGRFAFEYAVPAGVDSIKLRVTGLNDSGNEHFILQDLLVSAGLPDTDMDGMPDPWEQQFFGGLAALPTADADGDGQSNLAEFLAGTIPVSAQSSLKIAGIAINAGAVDLSFPSVTGKTYRAQSSQGLSGWMDIGVATPSAGATTTITGLPLPAAGEPHWFYRVKVVP